MLKIGFLLRKIRLNFSYLSLSLGIVYLWFGSLKLIPGSSPAEEIASETIAKLTFHLINPQLSLYLLAFWECTVGLLLILNIFRRVSIPLALTHILFTFTPLVFLPDKIFNDNPVILTLTGQYIIKNLVIISVLLFLWKQFREQRQKSSTLRAN